MRREHDHDGVEAGTIRPKVARLDEHAPCGRTVPTVYGQSQRQRAVLQLQSTHGNEAVTGLLSQDSLRALQRVPAVAGAPVVESSLSVTSRFVGASPGLINWGGGLLCESPVFSAAGTVVVPAGRADGDLTIGFMQALVGCTGPKGRYWDSSGSPYMTAFAHYQGLPLRDGDSNAGGAFYGPEAQKVIDEVSVSVSMGDQPQTSLPWVTPDGKGELQQVVGDHQFVTWLVVHSNATGRICPLRWISWSIGWFAAVDQSLPSGVPFGFGMVSGYGEGAGPLAPIRSGPVANDAGRATKWELWSG